MIRKGISTWAFLGREVSLEEQFKKAKEKFMIAHVIRFWPEYVYLKELVKRKELGRLKSITLTRLASRPIWSWDHVFSTFYYKSGTIAYLEAGWDMSENYPFTMAFTANFDKGTVEYNSRHNIFNIYKKGGEIESPRLANEITAEGSTGNIASLGGFIKEIEYFLNLCSGKKVSKVITPEDAVMSLKFIQEELKDARKKVNKN